MRGRAGRRWRRVTGSSWLRRVTRTPVARQVELLLCFIAAGVAVTCRWPRTWPGRIPRRGTRRATCGASGGSPTRSRTWATRGSPRIWRRRSGVELGFHTLMPLPGLLFTPLTLAFGPSFSYNLWTVMLLPGLLCYAMYRAARLWLRSATGAVARRGVLRPVLHAHPAGLVPPEHRARAPCSCRWPWRRRYGCAASPGRRQAIILGLVMGAAVLTDQESAVLAAIVVALVLLPWLLRRPSAGPGCGRCAGRPGRGRGRQPADRGHAREIRPAGGLSISPQLLAVSYKQYGIGLPGMFTPTPRVTTFGLDVLASPFLHGRDNEGMPMFGTTLTVLALLGLRGELAAPQRLAARRRCGSGAPRWPWAPRCGSARTSTCRWPRCGTGCGCPT